MELDLAAIRKMFANKPLVARWVQPNYLCTIGKPPSPRRSMMMARVGNGDTFIVFGGVGVNTGPASLDPADSSSMYAAFTFTHTCPLSDLASERLLTGRRSERHRIDVDDASLLSRITLAPVNDC